MEDCLKKWLFKCFSNMCCPAGFSSMLLKVLYHLGSVHLEKLKSWLAPQKPFCSRVWAQVGPWLTDTHFQQILPVGQICFYLCCSLIWTLLYPSCPNLHVASLCSCHGKTIRPDDSTDTKWTQIPNHFNQSYMQFMNCIASLFHSRDDAVQKKNQVG